MKAGAGGFVELCDHSSLATFTFLSTLQRLRSRWALDQCGEPVDGGFPLQNPFLSPLLFLPPLWLWKLLVWMPNTQLSQCSCDVKMNPGNIRSPQIELSPENHVSLFNPTMDLPENPILL